MGKVIGATLAALLFVSRTRADSAVLGYGPITLQAGERLTLRDRVIVHHGRGDPARLNAEYAEHSRPAHESK